MVLITVASLTIILVFCSSPRINAQPDNQNLNPHISSIPMKGNANIEIRNSSLVSYQNGSVSLILAYLNDTGYEILESEVNISMQPLIWNSESLHELLKLNGTHSIWNFTLSAGWLSHLAPLNYTLEFTVFSTTHETITREVEFQVKTYDQELPNIKVTINTSKVFGKYITFSLVVRDDYQLYEVLFYINGKQNGGYGSHAFVDSLDDYVNRSSLVTNISLFVQEMEGEVELSILVVDLGFNNVWVNETLKVDSVGPSILVQNLDDGTVVNETALSLECIFLDNSTILGGEITLEFSNGSVLSLYIFNGNRSQFDLVLPTIKTKANESVPVWVNIIVSDRLGNVGIATIGFYFKGPESQGTQNSFNLTDVLPYIVLLLISTGGIGAIFMLRKKYT